MTNPHRLPASVVPHHYRIRIEPDLDAATFSGTVSIDIETLDPVEHIDLHALDLEITSAHLVTDESRQSLEVKPVPEWQRIRVSTGKRIDPGRATLDLAFTGILNDLLVGFYRSTYVDGDGVEQTIATTQFEATDARRAFPCFDEPIFKATFGLTLTVPDHLMAISNYPEIARQPLGDGRSEVTFENTMKMSSYLVAFVMGPFEATDPLDVDGIPTRIVVPRGKLHLASYALECSAFVLRYMAEYYGIPYPGTKLDHVAIPDFAFGAMENLGCITYRESTLLVDRDRSSQSEKLRVLDTVGHEIAHMWFGDLVTMEWWDGIWLNEAFATFMEMKATDAARPEWKRWLAFAAEERPWAYGIDSLHTSRPVEFPVGSPDEANEMFDALTYGKGSSVLRMMEQFVGEDAFRAGVGAYLEAHSYSNTVTEDLWTALDAAAGGGVASAMTTWIHQRGYPQIDVATSDGEIRLTQRRYLSLPDETDTTQWTIPVVVRGTAGGEPFSSRWMVDAPEGKIAIGGPIEWFVVNAGGHGYYRVNYAAGDLALLVNRLESLDDIERFCLLDDAWAFVEAGQIDLTRFLDLVGRFRLETEQSILQRLIQTVGRVSHHLVDDETRSGFRSWLATVLRPAYERLGWEPGPDDTDLDRRMRGQVIGAMGRLVEDEEVITRAVDIGRRWLKDPLDLDPDVAQACVHILAGRMGGDLSHDLWIAYEGTVDPLRQLRLLHAMANGGDERSVNVTVDAILANKIRSQDAAWVSGELLSDRRSGESAWRRIRSDWRTLTARMPSMTISRLVEGLPALSKAAVAADVNAFFAETPLPAIERALSQQLERLEVNVRLRKSQSAAAAGYFSAISSD